MPDTNPSDLLVILNNALDQVPDAHLPPELKALQAGGGFAGLNFCTSWPTLKPMVQLLVAGVPAWVPTYGAILGAALTGAVAVLDTVYNTQCSSTP